MPSVLAFERYRGDLEHQLLRRIGYTNGLHKIHRFARVVEYLHRIMPASTDALVELIISSEGNLHVEGNLRGKEYARGIVDVASALLLIERFGPKLALSSQGYACHELNNDPDADNETVNSYLLHKVIDSDGEYTLNVLRLVSEGISTLNELGPRLMERFVGLIECKHKWAAESIVPSYARSTVSGALRDAQRKLQEALNKPPERVAFFHRHTVGPRLEWLFDLGCVTKQEGNTALTSRGSAVLAEVKRLGFWTHRFIFLPLDPWLTEELGLSPFRDERRADFSWRLAAAAAGGCVVTSGLLEDPSALLSRIKKAYPLVKLANFNEADALSLYEVFAATEARNGRVLETERFEPALEALVQKFPGEIFKLSKRRGRGLYVALKQAG